MHTIYSWNVNGIRAILKKGFLDWLTEAKPDVVCLQETKAHEGDLPEDVRNPRGYQSVWFGANKKGYSGTAVYYKIRKAPNGVEPIGVPEFDDEGRVQVIEFDGFTLFNAYWPNSQPERARLDYKLRFGKYLLDHCNGLVKKGRNVVLCGDFNVAPTEIDLARPKANRDNPGFYPEECEMIAQLLSAGYVDVFRYHHPDEEGHNTWWSYRANARAKNVGWRLDYHIVNQDFLGQVKKPLIHADVYGSDHCPVSLTIT